ncbi:hypothetical protein [Gilvimarinus sp. DA14]|uniref:hypothetical protein n=1 Tax=Gilvimarinus sp. DA14 TaxID=2956798 RepID=UPI0020B88AA8|nr:hypothetical protein [Gilvimarinus sp. DA14]UTF59383.1 hypothetical protein NHM04_12975 [Gilvimarinus sp. DA14]
MSSSSSSSEESSSSSSVASSSSSSSVTSSSSSSQAALIGSFSGLPISGLSYKTDAREGVTSETGDFEYDFPYDLVTFTLGDIELPAINAEPVLSPLSFTGEIIYSSEIGARGFNVYWLLLSLDDDSDWSNGIQIPEQVSELAGPIDFNLYPQDFAKSSGVINALANSGKSEGALELSDRLEAGAEYLKAIAEVERSEPGFASLKAVETMVYFTGAPVETVETEALLIPIWSDCAIVHQSGMMVFESCSDYQIGYDELLVGTKTQNTLHGMAKLSHIFAEGASEPYGFWSSIFSYSDSVAPSGAPVVTGNFELPGKELVADLTGSTQDRLTENVVVKLTINSDGTCLFKLFEDDFVSCEVTGDRIEGLGEAAGKLKGAISDSAIVVTWLSLDDELVYGYGFAER